MIHEIAIDNFRCFNRITIQDCRRINVLVGDNGSGKTALLEALFLALSGGSEAGVRLRGERGGISNVFNASPRDIEETIWRDYFHKLDWSHDIVIGLSGQGAAARRLRISRGPGQLQIPLGAAAEEAVASAPLTLTWTDATGRDFTATPEVTTQGGLRLPNSGEDLPDFFHLPAGLPLSSVAIATHFSALRRARREGDFIAALAEEYAWIEDLSIEVAAGSPQLFATVKGPNVRIPLASVSGGINRAVGLLAIIAARTGSVVLVDEIESGLYHSHLAGLWRSALRFARAYDSQLFVSTHSEEWLEALVEAAGEALDDIALWRLERGTGTSVVRQFSGPTLRAGIETGGELR